MSAGAPPAGNDRWTIGTLPLEYMSESGIHVAKSSPWAVSSEASQGLGTPRIGSGDKP